MPTAAPPISVSAAARALHPGLVTALTDAGLAVTLAAPVRIIVDDEPADYVSNDARRIRIGADPIARIMLAPAPECLARIDAAPDDLDFAAALIAALVRGADAPTAADPASLALLAMAERVALREITVLINGPTGTGKEVLARAIHTRSPRRDAPLVAVNCAALPETMLEAVLFGHERGAFTGALGASKGLFRAAQGGTLLLDEIAELPLALQAKLLRTLQEREVLPIGATTAVSINVRVIAAANRDLAREVEAGRFRSDLYYRLAVFPLTTLPLRDRPADLLPLTAALLLRAARSGLGAAWPTPAALARLAAHDWPGNVRELDNVLQRALIFCTAGRIEAHDIVFDFGDAAPIGDTPLAVAVPPQLSGLVRERETAAIRAALAACAGRRAAAARRLGISERTLRYKLAAMTMHDGAVPARAMMQ